MAKPKTLKQRWGIFVSMIGISILLMPFIGLIILSGVLLFHGNKSSNEKTCYLILFCVSIGIFLFLTFSTYFLAKRELKQAKEFAIQHCETSGWKFQKLKVRKGCYEMTFSDHLQISKVRFYRKKKEWVFI